MSHHLITGGAGFIGSHIAKACLDNGHQVTVIDNLLTGKKANIAPHLEHPNFQFIQADICDNNTTIEQAFKEADHVCHLAARISVPESLEIPEDYFKSNTIGTSKVATLAQKHCSSITLASSAAVYGNNLTLPKLESMLPQPMSPYAISKLDGEYLLEIAQQASTLCATSLRFFNVFGPRQDPNSAYAAAVPIFIDHAISHKDIIIYGDGEQTRDFIYVEDVARAYLASCQKGGGIINAACGRSISINALAKQIIDITGSRSQIIYQNQRPGDIKHSCANNSKLIEQLGIQPQADLHHGLEKTIQHFGSQ